MTRFHPIAFHRSLPPAALLLAALPLAAVLLSSCAVDYEADATLSVKSYLSGELDALNDAALELQAAAPEPDPDGWNATDDAGAIEAMRAAWKRVRAAYEHVEGAIAILFPMFDFSTDARYDAFIELRIDVDPFDGSGVTGMHAIERILWADRHPAGVVLFESALENYQAARFPETDAEARAFRDELVGRLIDDFSAMRAQFSPLALDPAAAFRGVIGSMQEQREKVNLAATGEDESRYSENTLADMRANLEGGREVYARFSDWVRAEGGEDLDARIDAGFARLDEAYAATGGDSLPAVPEGWNPDAPDPAQLETPYGQLWSLLERESNPLEASSLVADMNTAADAIGIPILP